MSLILEEREKIKGDGKVREKECFDGHFSEFDLENKVSDSNVRKKSIGITVFLFVVLVGFFIGMSFVFNNVKEKERMAQEEQVRIQQEQQEKKDNEFKYNMAVAANKMLVNATMGSKYITTYIDLYNKYATTFGENYVRDIIVSSGSNQEIVNSMKENNSIVVDNMKWLAENKSDNYSNVYETLLEMYENYTFHYNKAINLSVYSSNISEFKMKGNLILQKAEKMIVMQPDIEDIIDGKEK